MNATIFKIETTVPINGKGIGKFSLLTTLENDEFFYLIETFTLLKKLHEFDNSVTIQKRRNYSSTNNPNYFPLNALSNSIIRLKKNQPKNLPLLGLHLYQKTIHNRYCFLTYEDFDIYCNKPLKKLAEDYNSEESILKRKKNKELAETANNIFKDLFKNSLAKTESKPNLGDIFNEILNIGLNAQLKYLEKKKYYDHERNIKEIEKDFRNEFGDFFHEDML